MPKKQQFESKEKSNKSLEISQSSNLQCSRIAQNSICKKKLAFALLREMTKLSTAQAQAYNIFCLIWLFVQAHGHYLLRGITKGGYSIYCLHAVVRQGYITQWVNLWQLKGQSPSRRINHKDVITSSLAHYHYLKISFKSVFNNFELFCYQTNKPRNLHGGGNNTGCLVLP